MRHNGSYYVISCSNHTKWLLLRESSSNRTQNGYYYVVSCSKSDTQWQMLRDELF